jgi:hypothetical protein
MANEVVHGGALANKWFVVIGARDERPCRAEGSHARVYRLGSRRKGVDQCY